MTLDITKKVQVRVDGGAPIHLNPSEYVTSGGEGAIYRKGDTIYKVYLDSANRDDMAEKIGLLSVFKKVSGIVAPDGVLTSSSGKVLGYTMPRCEGETLVRLFTNDYQQQIGLTTNQITSCVQQMRDIVDQAHAGSAIMVDANEMNYLVSSNYKPSVIDVDSWQIGRFKASVIMPSIRDHHSNVFNASTDWFSWGVVTFQLFTGLHPYKGKHPGYKPYDVAARMKANVSVFNPSVKVPAAARDFKTIPKGLLDWYESVFEKGVRVDPPQRFDAVTPTSIRARTVITSTGTLKYSLIFRAEGNILKMMTGGMYLGLNSKGVRCLWNTKHKKQISAVPMDTHVMLTDSRTLTIRPGIVSELLEHLEKNPEVPTPVKPAKLLFKDNRLFSVHDMGMTELTFREMGGKILSLIGQTWNFNLSSTFIGNGAGVYDALGSMFVVMPIGASGCLVTRCPELDKMSILDVKAVGNFFCALVKDRKGDNHKLEILYNELGKVEHSWMSRTDEDVLNFAVNKNGIVATIVEDGKLTLFSPKGGKTTTIDDHHISTSMKLCSLNGNIAFIRDDELWSISMT